MSTNASMLRVAIGDSVRLTREEARSLESTIRYRVAGLFMMGIPRNELELEKLQELADIIAQWRVDTWPDEAK